MHAVAKIANSAEMIVNSSSPSLPKSLCDGQVWKAFMDRYCGKVMFSRRLLVWLVSRMLGANGGRTCTSGSSNMLVLAAAMSVFACQLTFLCLTNRTSA